MTEGLYYDDTLAWSEQQADLLRRIASGEQINTLVDWENVIEEVRDLGISELRACRSLLRQALIHLMKVHALPDDQAVSHWRGEAFSFLNEARDAYSPSMRQRLGLSELYTDAREKLELLPAEFGSLRKIPDVCPYDIAHLIAARPDLTALLAKLDTQK